MAEFRAEGGRRTPRRRWIVGVVAALLVSAFYAFSPARPASADIVSNIRAVDEDGVAQDLFFANEPIYGSAGTNQSGGYLCVTVVGGSACGSLVVPVPGFNSPSNPIPFASPGVLHPGTYELLGLRPNGTLDGRRSQDFTVSFEACQETDLACATGMDTFKAAATRMSGLAGQMLAWGMAKSLMAVATSYALLGVAYGLTIGGGIVSVGTVVGVAIAGGLALGSRDGPSLAGFARDAKIYFNTIANDPPDPNFETVAPPIFSEMPPPVDPVEAAAFHGWDAQVAYSRALLTAMERYQGATGAGSTEHAIEQLTAMATYADALAVALADSADALDALAGQVAADSNTDAPVTAGHLAEIADIQTRLATTGFTAEESQQLDELGVVPGDQADLLEILQSDVTTIEAGDQLSSGLREIAGDLRLEIGSFVAGADAAQAEADRLANEEPPVNTPPAASFTATPSSGEAPLDVVFNATGSTDAEAPIASYAWNFGDGSTGSGATADHTYTTAGNYTATLTVTDSGGLTATATRAITVGEELPNVPPTAVASTTTPAVGPAPLTVTLSGEESSDPDGTIVSYLWTFPNRSTLNGPVVQATLGAAGTVDVTLTVTDDDGDSSTATVTLRATAPPVARFTRTPAGGAPPLAVQFDATRSADEVGITGYAWSFGDGATGTGPTPQHTYPTVGTYTVTLTVTDTDGETAQASSTVVVVEGNEPPVVDAGPDVTLGESNRSMIVFPTASDPDGQITSYEWDYGDGSTSEGQVGFHAYATKGTFTATLTVTDDDGATASDSLIVTIVNDNPVITQLDVPARALPGAPLQLFASMNDPGGLDSVTGSWDFGDGSARVPAAGSQSLVSHAWDEPGTYDVTLRIEDGNGGSAQQTAQVIVQLPTIDAGPDVSGIEGQSVNFTRPFDGPQYSQAVVVWDFGDDTTDFGYSATYDQPIPHTYRDDGTYTVTATMHFNDGSHEPISDTTRAVIANSPPSITGIAASTAIVGAATSFQSFATDAGVDDVLSYRWDFGDGTTATDQAVEHTYAATGSYTVTATATDDGDSTSAARTVTVSSTAPDDGGISNSGREFWLAFNRNLGEGTNPELTLFVTASTDTSGTVEVPGLSFSTPFEVTAGEVTSVLLPPETSVPDTTGQDQQVPLAVHITADDDVAVYGLNYIPFTTDAFLALPLDALGTDYRTLSYATNSAHEVSVVPTRNDTEVTITPAAPLQNGQEAGTSYTQVVDIGEVLMLPQSSGDGTGTRIQSNHPVAVFSGMNCTNVPADAPYCDHIVEQLTPTSTWGRRFITTPLASRQNGDTFRIVAHTDDTDVRINDEVVATLDAGEFHERILTAASLIETSEPVLVAQYANGSTFSGNPGDPFMMIIPPYEQFLNSYTVTTPASGFLQNYVNVVAPGDGSGIALDGALIPASEFESVGDSGYSAAAIAVDPGTHRLSAARPFGLAIYGFNNDDSYGYTGGLSLSEVARVIEVELAPATGTAVVGASSCVIGTATDAGDAPVVGVRMDFVVSGVNPTSGFAVTDTAGRAEFCYSGTTAGADTITGSVSDVSDTAARTWRLPTVNEPPVATGSSVVTDEDVPVALTLAGSDPEGVTLSFAVVGQPAHGTLSGTAPNLTYTPAAGYFGSDSFTFTVNDGELTSASATVSITVNEVVPPNEPPVATGSSVVTDEDVPVAVTLAGSDPEGVTLSFAVVGQPAHGTLSGTAPNLTYTPAAGYFGSDSFTFTVNDGELTSASATVSITVNEVVPPNEPPVATGSSVVTDEDVPVAVTLAGSDPEGVTLSFAVVGQPAHGTLSGTAPNLTYTPAAGYFGSDSFTFTVNDGELTSASATVSITVNEIAAPNQTPIAKAQTVSTEQGLSIQIQLLGSDRDGDALTYAVASPPAHGTLSGAAPNLRYMPAPGFTGTDSFTFTVSDGKATSAPATVTVKIEPAVATANRLLVSDDSSRKVDVRLLDGQTFRHGEAIYPFVGPLDKISNIKRVTFWIDDPNQAGRPFSVESDKQFDLARTADNGKAYPFESNLLSVGSHIVTAKVEYKTGAPVVLSAKITIAETQAHRLQVSSRSDRTQASDLSGATVSGKRYVFLGTKGDGITGAKEVVFYLDGKKVRTDGSVDYDLVGSDAKGAALAYDTTKLRNGTHELVARVHLLGDDVEIVYRTTFTVKN